MDSEVELREELVLSRLTSVELLGRSEIPQVLVVREHLDFVARTAEVRPLLPKCFNDGHQLLVVDRVIESRSAELLGE